MSGRSGVLRCRQLSQARFAVIGWPPHRAAPRRGCANSRRDRFPAPGGRAVSQLGVLTLGKVEQILGLALPSCLECGSNSPGLSGRSFITLPRGVLLSGSSAAAKVIDLRVLDRVGVACGLNGGACRLDDQRICPVGGVPGEPAARACSRAARSSDSRHI